MVSFDKGRHFSNKMLKYKIFPNIFSNIKNRTDGNHKTFLNSTVNISLPLLPFQKAGLFQLGRGE
jgi:hypothetical protein